MRQGRSVSQAVAQLRPGVFRVVVHVKPGSRSTSIAAASMDEPIEMRIAAPPEGGKANKELIDFLEERLIRVAKSNLQVEGRRKDDATSAVVDVSVVQGGSSRNKLLDVVFPGSLDDLWAALKAEE